MPKVGNIVRFEGGTLEGVEDIKRNLRELPHRLGVAVGRRGLLAGARVIRDEARLLVPQPPARSKKGYSRTGTLKKAINSQTRGVFKNASGKPVEHRAVVLISKPSKLKGGRNARRYAHLVEFGTRTHAIGKGDQLEIRRGRRKHTVAAGPQTGGRHPGTDPQPFMRPAFDTKKLEAVRTIVEVTRREMHKELTKMRQTRRRAS